ncbi:MAG: hypothetical protein WC619_01885 [Patescibacteria group bacterium]
MANDIATGSFPEYWSRRMQIKLKKTKVYRVVSNFEEVGTLKNGDTVHRPYRSELVVNDLGAEGSYSRQDISDSNEYLTIDNSPEVTFYLKDPDEIQSNYKTANEYADDAADKLGDRIDGRITGEYDQADSIVANFEVGGGGTASDGIGFTLGTSNIVKALGRAMKKLSRLDVPVADRWGIISPDFYNELWEFIAGKESLLGDNSGQNGDIGKYGGFRLYMSNACGWSARLEFGTNPTANDTIVINGVTLTFKATLAAAGDLHIGTAVTDTLTNMVAAINTPGTSITEAATTGFTALSAANQKLMKDIAAVNGTTYMTLKGYGKSYVAVSETLSAAADIWTLTKQLQHNLFGQGKPIDLVIQKAINLKIKDRDGYLGKDFVSWAMFGKKTFDEGDKKLVDMQIRSDAF